MFIRITRPEGMSLLEISRFCGTAPCAIIAANGVKTEAELGQEMVIPVSTASMIRSKTKTASPYSETVGVG